MEVFLFSLEKIAFNQNMFSQGLVISFFSVERRDKVIIGKFERSDFLVLFERSDFFRLEKKIPRIQTNFDNWIRLDFYEEIISSFRQIFVT